MTRPLSWDELATPGPPWAYMVRCVESQVDWFALHGSERHFEGVIRIIRGERCSNVRQLLQEWAAALQFPYYFGHNWDAFEECLADLSWLPAPAYVLFVTRVNDLLELDPQAFKLFADILKKVASEWQGRHLGVEADDTRMFRVIFHSEPESTGVANRRLSDASLKPEPRALPLEPS